MKIALVILHADPSRGGAERYTIDLAAALAKRGHDVSLLASSFAQVPPGVKRVDLESRGFTRNGRYQRFLTSLDAHLADTSYDIVHAMLPVHQCDVYHPHAGMAMTAARESPLTALFNPRRRAMAEVEGKLLADGASLPVVLSLSEYVKAEIRGAYPQLSNDRLLTLFNAVDLNRYELTSRANRDRDHVTALFVGQDFERKGLAQAIEATGRLKDLGLTLTVVGRDKRSFRIPSSALGCVRMVGRVEDTRPYYREADFFVLPTTHDPCSLVVLEALATGLPVISTRFNGACEIMTDGVHGFVLPDPNDIDALADAMRKMLDPELRARMSAACLELRPKLSYEHHLDQLLSIYDQCLKRKQLQPR